MTLVLIKTNLGSVTTLVLIKTNLGSVTTFVLGPSLLHTEDAAEGAVGDLIFPLVLNNGVSFTARTVNLKHR